MEQYNITGMSCAACSARVEKAVSKVEGITSVSVNLLTNSMMVEGTATEAAIIKAVTDAGYGASPKRKSNKKNNSISHSGANNNGQAQASEADSEDRFMKNEMNLQLSDADELSASENQEISKIRKRLIASIILLLPLMYVSMGHMLWNWPLPGFLLIKSEMGQMIASGALAGAEDVSQMSSQMAIATGGVMVNHLAMGLYELLLTAIIMVINQKFFVNGFKGLLHKAPNMDTLVALGATASFGYSVYALFAMSQTVMVGDMAGTMHYMDEFYFESAATILTLITVGKYLEAKSKGRTTDALKSLMKLAPKTATLQVPLKKSINNSTNTEHASENIEYCDKNCDISTQGIEWKEITVPVDQVQIGDRFIVKPGENIPVDGIVLEGTSAVDEAALTGESIPVDKQPGNQVSAATINQSGYLVCQATQVGEDTTLAKIIQMVSDAAATKAPIAKIADQVSGIFVPVVMSIALVTFLVWLLVGNHLAIPASESVGNGSSLIGFALARAISVLVISCPCALGLATPVAIMVGNGVAAKSGVLFKTAASLEATGKAKIVVLDKTGTITKGEPTLRKLLPAEDISSSKLLELAYSLEQKSEHPLAKAIVAEAEQQKITAIPVEDFEVKSGYGLCGVIRDIFQQDEVIQRISSESTEGVRIYGGKLEYIQSVTQIPDTYKAEAETLAAQGMTPLFFALEDTFLGIIAVADVIKEDSKFAIEQLKALNLKVVMLTGDNEKTARAIGDEVGVDQVISGVLPDGKEAVIRRLQMQGLTSKNQAEASNMQDANQKNSVIMIGDGINDAPALTRADIGIAIGAGTDIAIDSADVVLMKSSLVDAVNAIRISRKTLLNIKENLFWAFIYNVIGIPLAAGVWIPIFGWTLNPMFGAAAMSLSSFCVVTNALRLNWFRPINQKEENQSNLIPEIKNQTKDNNGKERKNTMEIKVKGMMCGHCEMHVKKALEAIDGITEAVASHETGIVTITTSKDVAMDTIKAAIENEGYEFLG